MIAMSPFKFALRSRAVEMLRAMRSQATDRFHGMRTEQSHSLEEFGLANPDRVHYVPSSWKSSRVLAKVLRPTPEDTLLDLGSGKGRVVLLMALRLSLRRVIGVEISPELAAIAAENLERLRPRLKTRVVEFVGADAATFAIPEDVTIAYIYSSFTGAIFQSVLGSIEDKLPAFTGKRLIIVLQRPTNGTPRDRALAANDDYLKAQPWLTPLKRVALHSLTGWRSEIAFYQAFDEASGAARDRVSEGPSQG